MASNIQVLLPLICAVLAEAERNHHIPFFDIPGLPAVRPNLDLANNNQPPHKHVDYSGNYNSWYHHYSDSDNHPFSSDSNEKDDQFLNYDPFFGKDPYYTGQAWDQIPGINNVFNLPNTGFYQHRYQPSHKVKTPEEKPKHEHNGLIVNKPEEKPKETTSTDQKPLKQTDQGSKLHKHSNVDINNASEDLPPKTNKKNSDEKGDKDKKQVDITKKKDYLLVGQGGDGHQVYLLHENNPNPSTVTAPNTNQPGNNVIYVPYNPGQSNTPLYQIVNGQLTPLTTNLQMSPDKVGVNGYNTIQNSVQPANNLNSGSQNPGYVMVYSNGQLLQIPGVLVNTASNNVPLQNGNTMQGTNYIVANTVPNNIQNVPVIQNVPAMQTPGSNVVYATLPNQGTNGPIYIQMPNCVNAIPNNGCSGTGVNNAPNVISNNGVPGTVVAYQPDPSTSAGASNNYAQPTMVTSQGQGVIAVAIPNQGAASNNLNSPYQPAVELPVNSGSNGYNQPMVSNQGQVPNTPNQGAVINSQSMPAGSITNGYNQPMVSNQGQGQGSNQGGVMNNQNMPLQTAVEMPVNNNMNSYNQPMASNQGQGSNQGGMTNNQNMPLQTAVEMPGNNNMNSYNQPMTSNQGQGSNQGGMMNNQNMPLQPAVEMPVNNNMNSYNQPMASNQGQMTNPPNQGGMANNQNMQLQPAVQFPSNNMNGYKQPGVSNQNPNIENRGDMSNMLQGNSNSNTYSQPLVNSQGSQGTNAVVNIASKADVTNQPGNDQLFAHHTSSLVLDTDNLSSLGAQPAIMISGFKETKGNEKDKKKSKDSKEETDKGKKESKNADKDKKDLVDNSKELLVKDKDLADKPEDLKPFTNKKM